VGTSFERRSGARRGQVGGHPHCETPSHRRRRSGKARLASWPRRGLPGMRYLGVPKRTERPLAATFPGARLRGARSSALHHRVDRPMLAPPPLAAWFAAGPAAGLGAGDGLESGGAPAGSGRWSRPQSEQRRGSRSSAISAGRTRVDSREERGDDPVAARLDRLRPLTRSIVAPSRRRPHTLRPAPATRWRSRGEMIPSRDSA
jgi:hypothetical protein